MTRRIINIVGNKDGKDRKHSFVENRNQHGTFDEIINSEHHGEKGICMNRICEIQNTLINDGFTIRATGVSFQ